MDQEISANYRRFLVCENSKLDERGRENKLEGERKKKEERKSVKERERERKKEIERER